MRLFKWSLPLTNIERRNDFFTHLCRSIFSLSRGKISLETVDLESSCFDPSSSTNQIGHHCALEANKIPMILPRNEYSRSFTSIRALQQQSAASIDDLPGPSNVVFEDLVFQKSKNLKAKPKADAKTLKFGAVYSDHMLQITWTEAYGWKAPMINPIGPLPLHPCAQVFHYAIECFEGMKAFKGRDGCIRLFRPDMNMDRLLRSAIRVGLPQFDKVAILECIKKLLRVEKEWVPSEEGFSIYIRPTIIATDSLLGLGPTKEAMLFVVLSPVGPYFPNGLKPIRLFVDTKHARAFPGGVGNVKVGGNYAPTIVPLRQAVERGCSQVLYVLPDELGKNGVVGEAGAMNVFFLVKSKTLGEEHELITPALDGTILPGVTRDSVLQLAKSFGGIKVSERQIPFQEIEEAASEGRLIEAFGTGTACMVQPFSGLLKEDGTEIKVKFDSKAADHWLHKAHTCLTDHNQSTEPYSLTGRLTRALSDIYYGHTNHAWSVNVI